MRLARVHLADTAAPRVAIELDGCLYDVAELEERWRTQFADVEGASDWFKRVVALRGEGLAALDDRLARGERPTSARLHAEDLVWLPPCDDARQAFVQIERASADSSIPIRYRVGLARCFVGSGGTAWMPSGEPTPEVRPDIAVVLGDDLGRATVAEARRAILGVTLLAEWRALGTDGGETRERARHLGPVMSANWPINGLYVRVRIGERLAYDDVFICSLDTLAERLAPLSHAVPLRAGDVVGAGFDLGRYVAPKGALVRVGADGIGYLDARFAHADEPR